MKDLGKKKLLMIAGAIVGIVVLIIIILLIYHAINGSKTSYTDIENKVLAASKKYYNKNKELLPENDGLEVRIDDVTLTAAGYLKSMSSLTKNLNGASCSAEVVVRNVNGNYRYTPLLNCGEEYSSKTLASYINDNVSKVYTGEGLYELNGELVYRGEAPNNYVKISGKTYRIVKVVDNEVVLISNEKIEKDVWDDRYNVDRTMNDGINDYPVSRIYEKLNTLYNDNKIVSANDKSLLASHTLYIGKRNSSDNYNDGSIEKSQYFENQYVGLLPLYDYINASVDENCQSADNNSCANYNYLNYYDYNWWTITADASNSFRVYRVSSTGEVDISKASSNGYIRPVIYLAKDVLYVSGTGTIADPFIIK